MQSPHLIDARVIRDEFDKLFMRLVYSYEDEKGVHNVIFPKVDFPFPTFSIPVPSNEALPYRHYCSTGVQISKQTKQPISTVIRNAVLSYYEVISLKEKEHDKS